MKTVQQILAIKGKDVYTISEVSSLLEAARKMREYGVGCLVVTREDGSVSGIVTERDMVKQVASGRTGIGSAPVKEAMTSQPVVVCGPRDPLDAVRCLMKTKRVRQIPVMGDDGCLCGIVSLGDVNACLVDDDEIEIKYLHDYIEGRVW